MKLRLWKGHTFQHKLFLVDEHNYVIKRTHEYFLIYVDHLRQWSDVKNPGRVERNTMSYKYLTYIEREFLLDRRRWSDVDKRYWKRLSRGNLTWLLYRIPNPRQSTGKSG